MLSFLSPSWPTPPREWQASNLTLTMAYFGQLAPEPALGSAIMGAGKSLFLSELAACTKLAPNEIICVSTSTESLVSDLYHALRARCGQYKSVGTWYGRRKRMAQIVVVCVPSMQAFAEAMHQHGKTCALWIADEVHRSEAPTMKAAVATLKPAHSFGLTATAFRSDTGETISLFSKKLFTYGVDAALKDGVVVPWRIVNYQGDLNDADAACLDMIQSATGPGLTNATSIEDAKQFATYLNSNGIAARAIHSKLAPAIRGKILQDLQSGLLRCVVHVNLLTEGANYPWLMWLTLRREVESRVRFCQEAGRGLRSHGGLIWNKHRKAECVFYDPHDQFGSFDLSYREALGEAPPKEELPFDVLHPEENIRKISEADPPVAMAAIESAVRTIAVACVTGGIMGERKVIKKAERLKPSNVLQRRMLGIEIKNASFWIPDGWKLALNAIAERPECVRFGFAADLLASLDGIRTARRWPNVDAQGRISGMVGERVQEPTPELKFRVGKDGQSEIDFAEMRKAMA